MRRRHVVGVRGDTGAQQLLQQQPAPAEESAEWDRDYERQLFACAAKQVRGKVQDSTWQAFWRTTVDDKSAKDVALEFK